ncbi:MAG: hypothetical protein U5K69_23800 [Balneolaceae bacterium]|nr:hypothetical protein [Balneolaceae bacterium]
MGLCVIKEINNYSYILMGALMLIMLSSACQQNEQTDFESFSDQQKRSSEYALAGLETRDGLETKLFAAEDMLVNPTNMDIDAEGRVWVTEGYNYRPELNPENPTRPDGDRIVILEDTDEDGKADTSKVFYQGNDINAALGIMVLDNRVYVPAVLMYLYSPIPTVMIRPTKRRCFSVV